MLELAEEALDKVALAIERLAEAGLPFAVGLGGDIGHCALRLDQVANAVAVIGLVTQYDGARRQPVEQPERGRCIVRLASRQAEPDREPLGIDDDVDFGGEAAARATETRIWTPLFAVAACWCARIEVLSIIWI